VLAFAFERDVGVLDSNAARVLARSVTQRPITQAEADEMVPAGRGWAWNQALLDLVALVLPPPICQPAPGRGTPRPLAGAHSPDDGEARPPQPA
jgi:A/G-specific adenine glycosylase